MTASPSIAAPAVELVATGPADLSALSSDLRPIAESYLRARRRAGSAMLDAARALAAARAAAKHGEWYTFLSATSTSTDTADRLLDIAEQAARDPRFADAVKSNVLSFTVAGLIAKPSTPSEARAAVLDQAATGAAPTKRDAEQAIAKSRSGAGFAAWDCQRCGATITDMKRPPSRICGQCIATYQAERARLESLGWSFPTAERPAGWIMAQHPRLDMTHSRRTLRDAIDCALAQQQLWERADAVAPIAAPRDHEWRQRSADRIGHVWSNLGAGRNKMYPFCGHPVTAAASTAWLSPINEYCPICVELVQKRVGQRPGAIEAAALPAITDAERAAKFAAQAAPGTTPAAETVEDTGAAAQQVAQPPRALEFGCELCLDEGVDRPAAQRRNVDGVACWVCTEHARGLSTVEPADPVAAYYADPVEHARPAGALPAELTQAMIALGAGIMENNRIIPPKKSGEPVATMDEAAGWAAVERWRQLLDAPAPVDLRGAIRPQLLDLDQALDRDDQAAALGAAVELVIALAGDSLALARRQAGEVAALAEKDGYASVAALLRLVEVAA